MPSEQIIKVLISLAVFASIFICLKTNIIKNKRAALMVLFIIYVVFAVFAFNHSGTLMSRDISRTLHIPTRVLDGQTMYKDFDWFYGPLEPYANALLYKLFGVSYMTLQIEGIIFLGAIILLLFLITSSIFPIKTSFILSLLILAGTGINTIGIIMPYTFSYVYALTFSLLALFLFLKYEKTSEKKYLVLMGLSVGMTVISKQEYGFGIALATFIARLAKLFSKKSQKAKRFSIFLVSAVIVPLLVFGYFSTVTPLSNIISSIMPPTWNLNSTFSITPFYYAIAAVRALLSHNFTLFVSHSLVFICEVLSLIGIFLGLLLVKNNKIKYKYFCLAVILFSAGMCVRLAVSGMLIPSVFLSMGFASLYALKTGHKRIATIILLLIMIAASAEMARGINSFRSQNVLVDYDRIYAHTDSEGYVINDVVDYLKKDMSDYEIVPVIQNSIYPYILEKNDPIRTDDLTLGYFEGEKLQNILKTIEARKVKYILLANSEEMAWTNMRLTPMLVGRDYGKEFVAYVKFNYTLAYAASSNETEYKVDIYVRNGAVEK